MVLSSSPNVFASSLSFFFPDPEMRRSLLGLATETVQSLMDDSLSYIGWMKPTDSTATRFSPGRNERNLPSSFVGSLSSMRREPPFSKTASCDSFSCTSTPTYSMP